jgi:hypothetical protein
MGYALGFPDHGFRLRQLNLRGSKSPFSLRRTRRR